MGSLKKEKYRHSQHDNVLVGLFVVKTQKVELVCVEYSVACYGSSGTHHCSVQNTQMYVCW